METTNENSTGLSDYAKDLATRSVVIQAQRNLSMNAKFWTLINHKRIPYKMLDGKLVEAGYTESVKQLKDPTLLPTIYWLTNGEYELAQTGGYNLSTALRSAENEKQKLIPNQED